MDCLQRGSLDSLSFILLSCLNLYDFIDESDG